MRRLLLVDDTETDQKLALLAIRATGVQVSTTVARDGQEALDHLFDDDARVVSGPLDLVLLDVNLPKVGGLEVLRRARSDARTRDLPIVMFTSAAEPTDVASSFALGASAFVTKPAGFDELTDVLRTTLVFWLTLHQRIRR